MEYREFSGIVPHPTNSEMLKAPRRWNIKTSYTNFYHFSFNYNIKRHMF